MSHEPTVIHGTGYMLGCVENKDKGAFPECLIPSDPGEHCKWEHRLCKRVWFGF